MALIDMVRRFCADVQLIVNEGLGNAPPNHDLNNDGFVNVADVQKLINAAMGVY